jgi:cytochrome c553
MQKLMVALVLLALVWACAEKPKEMIAEKAAPKHEMLNGIVRSELAKTMRELYNELKLTRDSLNAGYEVTPRLIEQVEKIHTAVPTEADKTDETYHAMADLFITSYKAYAAAKENQVEAYNAMIETCVACHQQKCPGPVKTIKKLMVKE